jgi:hypothetical protein
MTHNADSAREYIEQKRIIPLVQAVSAAVAYSKPDNVEEFMKTPPDKSESSARCGPPNPYLFHRSEYQSNVQCT